MPCSRTQHSDADEEGKNVYALTWFSYSNDLLNNIKTAAVIFLCHFLLMPWVGL